MALAARARVQSTHAAAMASQTPVGYSDASVVGKRTTLPWLTRGLKLSCGRFTRSHTSLLWHAIPTKSATGSVLVMMTCSFLFEHGWNMQWW